MLSACIGQADYLGPFGRHKMTVLEIIIAVLYRFRMDGVLAYVHLYNCCCELGLCQ